MRWLRTNRVGLTTTTTLIQIKRSARGMSQLASEILQSHLEESSI
jgi:hypothetical protein